MKPVTLHNIKLLNITGGIAVANKAQYETLVFFFKEHGCSFEDVIPEYCETVFNVGRIPDTSILMINFKKCEYTFQPYLTQKECMEYLLAGKTLVRPDSSWCNHLNSNGKLTLGLEGDWVLAKEWYEEIPPEGVFCFVSSGEPVTEAYFALIERYDPESDCPFKASVVSWKFAIPVSREWALARVWRES